MTLLKPLAFLLIGVLVTDKTLAQTRVDTLANGILVETDMRYALLAEKRAEINRKAAAIRNLPKRGFRIQVLNTTSRTEALDAKARLLTLYPDHKTYLMYQAPYFKLRIGNFVERKDADALRKELLKLFPTGVFVIPSEIELKPEKDPVQQ
ncbi:MAG: SPOR domain-containing protein [Lacibacter sp.]